jgi:thioredoxin-like negative regulator of GroEL
MSEATKSRRQRLEEFLARHPNDPFTRYGLALECVREDDVAGALEQFSILAQQHPDYVPAYLQHAQLLVRLERREEARRVLSRGVTIARQKGDTHAADEMLQLLQSLG